jgi:hypothetical protein
MRTFLKIFTFLWIAFWVFIGISWLLDTPDQIISDKKFIEEKIKPSVDFVKGFKTKNVRLPNYREYYTWHRDYYKDYSSDLTQQVDSLIPELGMNQYIRKLSDVVINDHNKFKNVDWDKDFAIGVWRGEWAEYYFSWSDSYDCNNFSWYDGYIGLSIYVGMGIFPFLFWWLNIRQRKKSST